MSVSLQLMMENAFAWHTRNPEEFWDVKDISKFELPPIFQLQGKIPDKIVICGTGPSLRTRRIKIAKKRRPYSNLIVANQSATIALAKNKVSPHIIMITDPQTAAWEKLTEEEYNHCADVLMVPTIVHPSIVDKLRYPNKYVFISPFMGSPSESDPNGINFNSFNFFLDLIRPTLEGEAIDSHIVQAWCYANMAILAMGDIIVSKLANLEHNVGIHLSGIDFWPATNEKEEQQFEIYQKDLKRIVNVLLTYKIRVTKEPSKSPLREFIEEVQL